MDYLHSQCPNELVDLLGYFDTTYVSGTYRTIKTPGAVDEGPTVRFRRVSPSFPPALWNVNQATLEDGHRMNNACESWNNGFKHMLGHSHPSIWVAIEAIKKDQALVATVLLQASQGQLQPKRTRLASIQLQKRLKQLCTDYQHGVIKLTDCYKCYKTCFYHF